MEDVRLGRLVRALRQRRGWRQLDLAARAGIGRTVVAEIELGRVDHVGLVTTRAVLAAFGLTLELSVRGLGADLDRVLDERHARLVGSCSAWLVKLGWKTRAEVSYSEWGERGSIDLLAWHDPTQTLLVVEIKTELASVEATLRKHDEKVRLAPSVASRRLEWRPTSIASLLILPDERTQRRRVAAHSSVLASAYPARSNEIRRWCRLPTGPMAGLLFLSHSAAGGTTATRGRRHRVRVANRTTA